MLHYVPFMYFSVKREDRSSDVKEIVVIEDLNLIITFSKKIELFSLIALKLVFNSPANLFYYKKGIVDLNKMEIYTYI